MGSKTLKVKRLDPRAKLPTVAHPGEDLAYDLYALEDTTLHPRWAVLVRTGIAAQAFGEYPLGLLIRDRSSMAWRGIVVSGGVIDPGYNGEITVILTSSTIHGSYQIKAGDKIAQMVPLMVMTGNVVEVEELSPSARGDKGFGSTGR